MKPILKILATALFLSEFSALAPRADAQGGVPLWTNRYNGSGNGYDASYAVAVDTNGNVLVAGYSRGSGSGYDYTTLKYSGAGVPLWTNRYNGPANGDDFAYAMALDASGNVFVTGQSAGIGSSNDFATIKYSSMGVPLWTNRYNGPGNDDDAAYALAVDSSGNVLVTGSDYDYVTIKYSGAGAALWTNRYNGPGNGADYARAVAVDGIDNVLVTGYSSGGFLTDYDYATIKYSSAGVGLWTNRYSGPLNGVNHTDFGYAVAVDSSGNVFVTGYSFGDGTGRDFATIKYSSAGAAMWTNRYDGPGHSTDETYTLTVDTSGNVYVTGVSYGIGTENDFATIKYSGAGAALWTNRYNGPASGWDGAYSVAVDGSGNVFVTGISAGNDCDFATIKYSSTGVALWTNRYDGPANGCDGAYALTVDCSGNVLVTGPSFGSGSDFDFATIKYSSLSPIPLDVQRLNNQLVLSWTNAGFDLQSAPAITGTFTNVPGAASPFTTPLAGPQQFFRLKAN